MRLLNYALRAHSWEKLYGLGNGISFCWGKHAYTLRAEKGGKKTRTQTLNAHR